MISDDYIVMMDHQVADRSRRQIHFQRLPMVAIVPRHIHGTFHASKEQSLAFRIFSHRVDRLILGQAAYDFLPSPPAVMRAIDIGTEVVKPKAVHRRVGSGGIEM